MIYRKKANRAPAKPSERTGSRRPAAPEEGEGEPELVEEVLVPEDEVDLVPEPEVVVVPEPDEPVVLFPLLLPPVVVPLEATPPDDGEVLLLPVLPLPEPTGTVLLLGATGATGTTGAGTGPDAGTVATGG